MRRWAERRQTLPPGLPQETSLGTRIASRIGFSVKAIMYDSSADMSVGKYILSLPVTDSLPFAETASSCTVQVGADWLSSMNVAGGAGGGPGRGAGAPTSTLACARWRSAPTRGTPRTVPRSAHRQTQAPARLAPARLAPTPGEEGRRVVAGMHDCRHALPAMIVCASERASARVAPVWLCAV